MVERFNVADEPRVSLDIGRCFQEAIEVYKLNLVPLVFAGLVQSILIVFPPLVLGGALWGGTMLLALRVLRREDKRVNLGDIFSGFSSLFIPLTLLYFLVLLLILVGMVMLVLPGLVLATIWLYPALFVVDQDAPVLEAMRRSHAMVMRGGFSKNFALLLLSLVLTVGVAVLPYVGVVIGWFVGPFVWLVTASAYLQQRPELRGADDHARDEGPDIEPVTF